MTNANKKLTAEFEAAAKTEAMSAEKKPEFTPGQIKRMREQAPEMYRAIIAKLKDCREIGGCSDAALMEGEYCSDECSAMALVVGAVDEQERGA